MFSHFIFRIFLLSFLFTLTACGGGEAGDRNNQTGDDTSGLSGDASDNSVDNTVDNTNSDDINNEDDVTVTNSNECSDAIEPEGLSGVWEMSSETALGLQAAALNPFNSLSFDPDDFVDIGLFVFDNGESISLGLCETYPFSQLTRSGDELEVPDDFTLITESIEFIQGMTVQDDSTITVDIGLGILDLYFKKTDIDDNDVCLVIEGEEKLSRATITCIDEPLFPVDDDNAELVMGIISGDMVYRLGLQLGDELDEGTFDLEDDGVSVVMSSLQANDVTSETIYNFVSGTITIIDIRSDGIEGALDLVTDDGTEVRMDFNSGIY